MLPVIIKSGTWPGIPVGMGRSPLHEHPRARVGFYYSTASLNMQSTFHYVPGLVVVVMQVPRCNEPRLFTRAARIAPLRDYEIIALGTHCLAGPKAAQKRLASTFKVFPSSSQSQGDIDKNDDRRSAAESKRDDARFALS